MGHIHVTFEGIFFRFFPLSFLFQYLIMEHL